MTTTLGGLMMATQFPRRRGAPLLFSNTYKTSVAIYSDGDLSIMYQSPDAKHALGGVTRLITEGKYYWETTVVAVDSIWPFVGGILPEASWLGALADPPTLGDLGLLGGGNSIYIRSNGTMEANNSLYVGMFASLAPGDIIRTAYDFPNEKIWFGKNSDAWPLSGDPETGLNPTNDPTGMGLIPLGAFPQRITMSAGTGTPAAKLTANFGITAFAYAVPSGFLPAIFIP